MINRDSAVVYFMTSYLRGHTRDGGQVIGGLDEEVVVLLKVQVCQPCPQYLRVLLNNTALHAAQLLLMQTMLL